MAAPQEKIARIEFLLSQGRFEQARAAAELLLRREPSDMQVLSLMATALLRLGRPVQAVHYAARAAEAHPAVPELRFNVAQMLTAAGRPEEAIAAAHAGLALAPDHPLGLRQLAEAQLRAGHLGGALETCRLGRERHPADPFLAGLHATAQLRLGDATGAVSSLRHAVRLGAPNAEALLAFAANCDPCCTPEEVLEAHRLAGEQVARTVPRGLPPVRTHDDPDRRLRVGFLSPEFRAHAIAHFMAPLLAHLDRTEFHVTCYHVSMHVDEVTAHLRSLADAWRHETAATPKSLHERIVADRIDVIIDLTGYTEESLTRVCAARPAPLTATYLGYPATSGCSGIDVRFVDARTDPPRGSGEYDADALSTERLVRIEGCFVCYAPLREPPPVAELPARTGRRITFATFNAFHKINPPLIALWARVLDAVPGSRLMLKSLAYRESEVREALTRRFEQAGITRDRIEVVPPTADMRDHLRMYDRVDIALDTFPYCGTTTTCEALLMGVPVVSLVGRIHAARVGLSLLAAAGVEEWAVRDEASYVRRAAQLAADIEKLAEIRKTLRARMLASSLCDGPVFGRRFGAALREAWRQFCRAATRP